VLSKVKVPVSTTNRRNLAQSEDKANKNFLTTTKNITKIQIKVSTFINAENIR